MLTADAELLPPDPLWSVELLELRGLFLVFAPQPIFVTGADETGEERMWLQWFRLELRVELAAQEVRVIHYLDDLNVGAVRRCAGDTHARASEHSFIFAIEFIAVPVTLANLSCTIRFLRQ